MSTANENPHAEAHPVWHQHHYHTPEQQRQAASLGMWLFLAQEVLFFSGLFMAYTAYRYFYPQTYLHAHEGLDWRLGALNTFILLTSSFTMAMGVRAAQLGNRRSLLANLWITMACAGAFMVVKAFEYAAKWEHGFLPGRFFTGHLHGAGIDHQPQLFFGIYFIMTGIHGLHVLAGMGVIGWIILRARRNEFGPRYYTPVENVGLYWHLVDLIWIYLFPLLYLVK